MRALLLKVLVAAWIAIKGGAVVAIVAAGGGRWAPGWIWLGIVAAGFVLIRRRLPRRNPFRAGRLFRTDPDAPPWDRAALALYRAALAAVVVVAFLDGTRYHWSVLPWWSTAAGIPILAGGLALLGSAKVRNPYFEDGVRVRRGHLLVDGGPYAMVRHPGYLAFAAIAVGSALVLGSGWALAPAAAGAAALLARAALEDRFLHERLPGYRDYARRVRFRTLPGIW